MTKDQYLTMCEQTGEEVDWDRCPPELEDFPIIVPTTLNIYNSLGSRIYPEVGFVGKDYTTLDLLFKVYKVQEHEKDFIYDILLALDAHHIEASQKSIKAEYDKIKSKHK
tara:strand:- start:44 stop:373 length:330 start_codon:yes stop_codon:yes gene_type:complete